MLIACPAVAHAHAEKTPVGQRTVTEFNPCSPVFLHVTFDQCLIYLAGSQDPLAKPYKFKTG